MRAHIKLGRIIGVPVGLHLSWFVVAVFVTLSLVARFYAANPDWGGLVIWSCAIAAGLFFFVTLLAHELSHAVVARRRGLAVRGITLFALGGVSETRKNSPDAMTEFKVAIVGPITSALIGCLCLGVAWALGWVPLTSPPTPPIAILVWLGYINIALAAFNMVPGFPLDGGRVLRAVVWWATGDALRSARIAALGGQLVGIALMVFGFFRFFDVAALDGLWLVLIGWFLFDAARSSYAQAELAEAPLGDVSVRDAMSHDCFAVDGRLNLQTFVDEVLMRTARRCFVVEEKGVIIGLITPHETKEIDRMRWHYLTVNDVMRPIGLLQTVRPDASIIEALELMGQEDVNQLPVTSNGHVEGVLTRSNIVQLLRVRSPNRIRGPDMERFADKKSTSR
jgi:Zn-dependent protease/predicted transcriptional regulator